MHLKYVRLFAATLTLIVTTVAGATEATSFSIIKSEQPVGLTKELHVRVAGGDLPDDLSKVQLLIEGTSLGVGPRVMPDNPGLPGIHELAFDLQRTEAADNRKMWARLLGSPSTDRVRSPRVSLTISGKALAYKQNLNRTDEEPKNEFLLATYDPAWMALAILLVGAVIVVTAVACKKTAMIRDAVAPQLLLTDRPYSLGRFQMAVWFCVIFASFIFILAVTGDINSINAESFILLGISGATALASIAVDQSKVATTDVVAKAETDLAAAGLVTQDDTKLIKKAVAPSSKLSPEEDKHLQQILANATIPQKNSAADIWNAYEQAVAPIKSKHLLQDLVNDLTGPTIHRWQVLIWTLVIAGIYLVRVYANLETPTLGANLLTLMGISSGVYVGFKIPERQT